MDGNEVFEFGLNIPGDYPALYVDTRSAVRFLGDIVGHPEKCRVFFENIW